MLNLDLFKKREDENLHVDSRSLIPDKHKQIRTTALEQYEQVFTAGWRLNGWAERFFTLRNLANFINKLDVSLLPFVFGDLLRHKAALQASTKPDAPEFGKGNDLHVRRKLKASNNFSEAIFSNLVFKLNPEAKKVFDAAALAFFLDNQNSSPNLLKLSKKDRSSLLVSFYENNSSLSDKNKVILVEWVEEIVASFADTQPIFYNQIMLSLARNDESLELLSTNELKKFLNDNPEMLMRIVTDLQQAMGLNEKNVKYSVDLLFDLGIQPSTLSLFKEDLSIQNREITSELLIQIAQSNKKLLINDYGTSVQKVLPFMDALFAASAHDIPISAVDEKSANNALFKLISEAARLYIQVYESDQLYNSTYSNNEHYVNLLKTSEELKRIFWFDAIIEANNKHKRFSAHQVEIIYKILCPSVILHDTCEAVLESQSLRNTAISKEHIYMYLLQDSDEHMTKYAVTLIQSNVESNPLCSSQLTTEDIVTILKRHPELRSSVVDVFSNLDWLMRVALQNKVSSRLTILDQIEEILNKTLLDSSIVIDDIQIEFMYNIRKQLSQVELTPNKYLSNSSLWPEQSELALLTTRPELAVKWYGDNIVQRLNRITVLKTQAALPMNASPTEVRGRFSHLYSREKLTDAVISDILMQINEKMNNQEDDAVFYELRDARKAIRFWWYEQKDMKSSNNSIPYLVELFRHKIIFE